MGSSDDDIINGLGGNDTLIGAGGDDEIYGGDGDDILYGGLIDGSNPNFEVNYLYGGAGADTFYGGNWNNTYYVSLDDLLVDGRGRFDRVIFQETTAVNIDLNAMGGIQFIDVESYTFTDFDDVVIGDNIARQYNLGSGNDMLTAGFTASGVNVSINLGDGDDTVIAGGGDHFTFGGDGTDTVDYSDASGGIRITFNTFGTTVDAVIRGGDGGKATARDVEVFIGTDFKDVFSTAGKSFEFFGGGGDDIFVTDGFDVISGGTGYDRVYVDETLYDQNQGLNLDMGAQSIEYAKGGSLIDTIDASSMTQSAIIFGEGGNDILTGSAFNDLILGGDGDDQISRALEMTRFSQATATTSLTQAQVTTKFLLMSAML